ncbi:MAG: superoxide dismutase [Fe] [Gammaproteobacteria bacterium]|nr:superoxide dismutase [Fe] [Gammaproteobacteria bacterium]MCH9764270.1 superoxide dismutase [Fe] [Gammaproteobacteria bacterium]
MTFTLPALPYAMDALVPHMSQETLEYHYGKHHQTYVTNLNNLVADTDAAGMTLEDLIKTASGGVFNNAAQIWNHSFFWQCLTPESYGEPRGELLQAIQTAFGSFDAFKAQFTEAAVKTFGSGWAWLVQDDQGALSIMSTSNAANPMTSGLKPLLTCDVWEHAYYIDYRNRRPDYLQAFWALVHWDFVSEQLG